MSATTVNFPTELPQDEIDIDQQSGFEFELHYDIYGNDLRHIFSEILNDSSPSHLHNWDKKLRPSPVHAIAKVGAKNLRENGHEILVTHSTVEEVLPILCIDRGPMAVQETDDISSRLFFTKTTKARPARPGYDNTDPHNALGDERDRSGSSNRDNSLNFAQGRIIYIEEEIPYLERAALLTLYTFCIRLQYEDYGYIRAFIERHLSLRSVLKLPYHWQETSPPQLDTLLLKCYKRVTISCHIAYLTLNSGGKDENGVDQMDRAGLFLFQHKAEPIGSVASRLFKASASVLLTLAVSEESISREEEIKLLSTPQALWTILVVNSSLTFTSSYEPRQYLTPIAQFVRGIASLLYTQKTNARLIHDSLRDLLVSCDDGNIFDDENFTKSKLYHWIIKTCDALNESLASNLRFTQKVLNSRVEKLCSEAHDQEKMGIDYWVQQLQKEISELEDFQAQILAMKSQVQENRNALHGVTAVLESRLALQQGERMNILAYLATIYLPLTACSSIYSMSVLPASASFLSFFVILAIFFIFTTILIFNLGTFIPRVRRPDYNLRAFIPRVHRPGFLVKIVSLTRAYIHGYMEILNPFNDYRIPYPDGLIYKVVWWIIRGSTLGILRSFLLREINMPYYQYYLFQYRNNPFFSTTFHPIYGIQNLLRGMLIPAWIALAVVIICYHILLDILSAGFRVTILGLGQLLVWCKK